MSSKEVAELIERFLGNRSLYPQEWNDFVETPQSDEKIEKYKKRCFELDPFVNRPEDPEPGAITELQSIMETLKSQRS